MLNVTCLGLSNVFLRVVVFLMPGLHMARVLELKHTFCWWTPHLVFMVRRFSYMLEIFFWVENAQKREWVIKRMSTQLPELVLDVPFVNTFIQLFHMTMLPPGSCSMSVVLTLDLQTAQHDHHQRKKLYMAWRRWIMTSSGLHYESR